MAPVDVIMGSLGGAFVSALMSMPAFVVLDCFKHKAIVWLACAWIAITVGSSAILALNFLFRIMAMALTA
jgi:hypothetical protein